MTTKRVYHPVTNEPFDLPAARAEALVLEKGWLQTPIDPTAEPAVSSSPQTPVEESESDLEDARKRVAKTLTLPRSRGRGRTPAPAETPLDEDWPGGHVREDGGDEEA